MSEQTTDRARPRPGRRLRGGLAAAFAAALAATGALTAPAASAAPPASTPGTTASSDGPSVASAPPLTSPPDSFAVLDRLVRDARAVGVVAQVQQGRRTWGASVGVAAKGRPVSPMPDARFRAASVTKQLVAVLVLQEVEAGRLTLDSTLGELLPGVYPGRETTTVRALLSHTSGIPDYLPAFLGASESYGAFVRAISTKATDPELVALAQTLPLGEPGVHSYSNTNFVLLGMALERLNGRPVGELMTERVLEPAGMDDSLYPTGRVMPRPRMKEYLVVGKRRIDLSTFQPSTFSAAGALVSTAPDLNRFRAALDGGRLIDRSLVRQMRTPVAIDPQSGFGYGLGSYVLPGVTCQGRPVVGHDGASWGTYTFNFSSGGKRLTVAVTGRDYTPSRLGDQSRLMLRFATRTFDEICGNPGRNDKNRRPAVPVTVLPDAQASVR